MRLYYGYQFPTAHFRPFTSAGPEQGSGGAIGGGATSVDGVISTRRGNAGSWTRITDNKSPIGEWELALPNTVEMRDHFTKEEIDDILLVITYAGRTPAWPT